MFDPKPSSWIASWSEDGTAVTFQLADLTQELTADEADADTGDWRDCFFSLVEHTYNYFANLPAADKPSKVTLSRSTSQIDAETLRRSYSFSFETQVTGEDVLPET